MTTPVPQPPQQPPDLPPGLAPETPFAVEQKRVAGGAMEVAVEGAIDLNTAPAFRRALGSAARETGNVVVDLSRLEFIDSTGLHVLVCAYHDAMRDGWRLRIIAAPDGVQKVFRMTELVRVLPFVAPGDGAAPDKPV